MKENDNNETVFYDESGRVCWLGKYEAVACFIFQIDHEANAKNNGKPEEKR